MTMPAPNLKRIVCFANSRRNNGRCVAGKELLPDGRPGPWLRPVSSRDGEEVAERERQYADGSEPRLLEVITLPVLHPQPFGYQSENWRLDPTQRWAKSGGIGWDDLSQWTDPDAPLWSDGYSSGGGQNDRIPVSDVGQHTDSLRLIRVDSMRVSVLERPRPSNLYPVLRGNFRYNGADYSLRITDAEVENGSIELEYGEYPVGERYLTISLAANPLNDYIYKLIAAIIRPS